MFQRWLWICHRGILSPGGGWLWICWRWILDSTSKKKRWNISSHRLKLHNSSAIYHPSPLATSRKRADHCPNSYANSKNEDGGNPLERSIRFEIYKIIDDWCRGSSVNSVGRSCRSVALLSLVPRPTIIATPPPLGITQRQWTQDLFQSRGIVRHNGRKVGFEYSILVLCWRIDGTACCSVPWWPFPVYPSRGRSLYAEIWDWDSDLDWDYQLRVGWFYQMSVECSVGWF